MPRSLVVIVLALAMSAQAQEAASTPEGEEKRASSVTAPEAEGEQSQAVVASIEPAGSQRPALPQTAPAVRSDAGVAGLPEVPTDCGIQQSMLADEDPPVAVRSYRRKAQDGGPDVRRAGRCLEKCIIQVWSQTKEPWVLKNARIEGPGGEVLKVTGIRSQPTASDETINVIVAERTNGAALASKMVLTLHLTAEDGRVALLQEELP